MPCAGPGSPALELLRRRPQCFRPPRPRSASSWTTSMVEPTRSYWYSRPSHVSSPSGAAGAEQRSDTRQRREAVAETRTQKARTTITAERKETMNPTSEHRNVRRGERATSSSADRTAWPRASPESPGRRRTRWPPPGDSPRAYPPMIVAPEREVPGTSESTWASPMPSAVRRRYLVHVMDHWSAETSARSGG